MTFSAPLASPPASPPRQGRALSLAAALLACAAPQTAAAQEAAAAPAAETARGPSARACAAVAHVVAARGDVRVMRAEGGDGAAEAGAPLCAGDRIVTGTDGQAALRFSALDTVLRLNVDTTLVISGAAPGDGADVTLIDGMMRFLSSVRSAFTVRTALYSMTIDGTEVFVYAAGAGRDGVLTVVEEGDVSIEGLPQGASDGQAVFAAPDAGPRVADRATTPPVFHPYLRADGTIDWAIQLPPMALLTEDPAFAGSVAAMRAGDPDAALARLDLPPPTRAATPAEAPALAFASLTTLARGDRRAALALAERAVAADPASAAAYTARGFARQADGRIDLALADAQEAARLAPDHPMTLARLAETALIRGDLGLARDAADRSLAAGETAYGRAMAGFSDLTAYRDEDAAAQFDRALEINPASTAARLGAAFSLIADGRLEAGRAQLEDLAAIDPRSARVRTMLGRAYFEEGRPEKARAQFARAERFDPDDPTPHLYAARERYAANRPVAALRELEAAQAKGARRAPLRGARGLAEDDALRGAATGRVFGALGFEQLSVIEAARAARRDPTSVEGHRFLAEAYRNRPDHGPARTSELLVSQLFAGPSKTPAQPQLGESNLALTDAVGAARVTFEEFAPLFDRDGLRFDLAGAAGTQRLAGAEGAATALSGPVSVSFGAFHFETEGDAANDDAAHDILTAQTHVQASPELTLFGEYRYRETDEGERVFSQTSPRTGNRFSFDDNRARVGLRYAPSGVSDFVAFGAWRRIDGLQRLEIGDAASDSDGFDVQFRHDRRMGDLRLILGGGWTEQTTDVTTTVTLALPPPLGPLRLRDASSSTVDHGALWAYGLWTPQPWLEATLGLALHAESATRTGGARRDSLDLAPKLGLEADLGGGLGLRAAYARTVKRPLLFDETLEPTQVAGFNQVFADLNGTVSDMAGLGLDWQASPDLWFGAEGQLRWAERPEVMPAASGGSYFDTRVYDMRTARLHGSYLIDDDWSLSLGLEYERTAFHGAGGPSRLESFLAPARLRWTHPSGLFAALDATPFHQRAREGAIDGDSTGLIVDAAIGWRLPDQRGIVSLEAQNILNSDFTYQDSFVRTEDDKPRRFSRDFAVIARASFRF